MKPLCGAKTRAGGKCKRPAGWGTDHVGYGHCKLHLGSTISHRVGAAAEEARADAMKLMGDPISVDPFEAIQFGCDLARSEVEFYTVRINEITVADAAVSVTSRREHQEVDRHGDVHDLEERTTTSSAELNVFIVARASATDRLVRYAKVLIDCGVAERAARLDERQANLIASALIAVLAKSQTMSAEERAQVPGWLAEHVGALTAPVIEGSVA